MRHIIVLLIVLVICAACAPAEQPSIVNDLPEGIAANGETLFNSGIGSLAACEGCHSLDGTRRTGPSLQNFAATAATRPGGDPFVYTATSIVNPGAFVVGGFSNVMPPNYSQVLSRQQLADLIAYLLTL